MMMMTTTMIIVLLLIEDFVCRVGLLDRVWWNDAEFGFLG